MCQISSRSVYSVDLWLRTKTIQFVPFLEFGILWCRQLAAIWESWTRMYKYKPSPIQRYQNRFCTRTSLWQNQVHNLWHSKAWWTDSQKKLNVFGHPGSGWNPNPTKLGMVIEDLEHVLAPPNFWGLTHSFAYGGALKICGEPDPLNLKPPNSVTLWANPSKF